MPPFGESLLAVALLLLAVVTLLERRLVRACIGFVLFALTVALAWARLGLVWLALLELVLGAVLTGAFLFHALGVSLQARPRGGRRYDPEPLACRPALACLLPAAAVPTLIGVALVAQEVSLLDALRPAGLGLLGAGLWAFSLHRHLLRRLLAFNVIGTGIFLLLMSLAGDGARAAAHGLVISGLLVALLGTALGALLIRRLEDLEPPGAAASAHGDGAP
ncbi:hypothetical protein [Billgrantia sulfidoxydans]|uniref:hypothetical protein n=1 Tax=Billgrantia sulfidoxydans TaxID=2733484 RepID=UPI001AE3991B|nr:hypothetical protein [Halomonas sulfidoxydans]